MNYNLTQNVSMERIRKIIEDHFYEMNYSLTSEKGTMGFKLWLTENRGNEKHLFLDMEGNVFFSECDILHYVFSSKQMIDTMIEKCRDNNWKSSFDYAVTIERYFAKQKDAL